MTVPMVVTVVTAAERSGRYNQSISELGERERSLATNDSDADATINRDGSKQRRQEGRRQEGTQEVRKEEGKQKAERREGSVFYCNLLPHCQKSVSYTHLTLPTKRIV